MADQTYGGFWVRVLAYLVDSVILFSAFILLGFVAGFLGETGVKAIPLLCLLVSILYWGLMHASARQATFGKALLGMKVTDTSGNRISILRSLGRELAKIAAGIPMGLGYLMAAFTGRKQGLHDMIASTTVIRESSGHVLIGLLVAIFGWILPAGLAMVVGGALIAVMMGTMGGDVFRGAMTDSPKRVAPQRTPTASRPAAPAAAAPAAPASQPAAPAQQPADVETIVASQLAGFEKSGTTRAGPVVLEIDQKFLFGSDFTITTYLPPYPELRGRSIAMQINSVQDANGANIYDPANTFEKDPFFTSIDLSAMQSPVSHLEGRRRVRLKKGVDAKSVDRVDGIVHLNIAQNTQPIALGRGDVGKSKAANGVRITMKNAKDRQIELQFSDRSRVLATRGLDADERPVRTESSSFSGDSSTYTFAALPDHMEVLVAESFVKRSFPFTLTRASVAAPPGVAPIAATPAPSQKPVVAPEPKQTVSADPVSKPEPVRKPVPEPMKVAAAAEPSPAPIKAAPEASTPAAPPPQTLARAADEAPAVPRMPARPGPKYADLMSAVMAADSAGVRELLAFGKWPDKPDSNGFTPLMVAAMRGDRDSAELLLKAGANPDRAHSVSRQKGDPEMTALLERYLRR